MGEGFSSPSYVMFNETQTCNLALSHIGVSVRLSNLFQDKSLEAESCRLVFEIAKISTLKDFAWPFASKYESLSLVKEDPNIDWGFSYAYPTDCINIVKIPSGVSIETEDTKVPFEIGTDGSRRLIFTNQEKAEAKYVHNLANFALYSSDFVFAHSFKLAAFLINSLGKGDIFKQRRELLAIYENSIGAVKANALNEQSARPDPESSFVRAR